MTLREHYSCILLNLLITGGSVQYEQLQTQTSGRLISEARRYCDAIYLSFTETKFSLVLVHQVAKKELIFVRVIYWGHNSYMII